MKRLYAAARRHRFRSGATRLGLLDVLTALILLALLIWASWEQFPAYRETAAPSVSGRANPNDRY